jgi:hypothetical protein
MDESLFKVALDVAQLRLGGVTDPRNAGMLAAS